MKLYELPAHTLRDMIQQKSITCTEVLDAVFGRIRETEPLLSCYITLTAALAYEKAKEADAAIAAGKAALPLAGVPVAVKDNICVKNVPATCASMMLQSFVPPYSATAAEKLFSAGALLLGKTNMDEFGMGSSTENSAFQATKNPYNTKKVPGGSSGGSAAAVAAGAAPIALGTDTGGSCRQPAAFCGCVGLKPTYGAVSRYGLIAFASSFDQIGPIAQNVRDAAMLLDVITGCDPKDATALNRKHPSYEATLTGDVRGLKIGVPQELLGDAVDKQVASAVYAAAESLRGLGADCVPMSLSTTTYALPAYYILSSAEASSNLARYDGVKYGFRAEGARSLESLYEESRSMGFGSEVKRRIMLGTYVLSAGYSDAYYKKAQQARRMVADEFRKAFETYNILITPVSPTTAFGFGEKTADPVSMYAGDICTVSVSLAGLPAVSVPCGYDAGGLPIGVQLIGNAMDEATLLNAAYALEQTVSKMRPSL